MDCSLWRASLLPAGPTSSGQGRLPLSAACARRPLPKRYRPLPPDRSAGSIRGRPVPRTDQCSILGLGDGPTRRLGPCTPLIAYPATCRHPERSWPPHRQHNPGDCPLSLINSTYASHCASFGSNSRVIVRVCTRSLSFRFSLLESPLSETSLMSEIGHVEQRSGGVGDHIRLRHRRQFEEPFTC